MNKIISALAIVALSIFFSSVVFAATTTGTLEVYAQVSTGCLVSTSPVSFPITDLSIDETAEGEISVLCAVDIPYLIALDAGMNYDGEYRNVNDGGGNNIHYGLFVDNSYVTNSLWGDIGYGDTYPWGGTLTNTGTGTFQPHIVFGYLLSALAGSVPDGTYTDIVNVTVTY